MKVMGSWETHLIMSLWLNDPGKNFIESRNLRTQSGSCRGWNVLIYLNLSACAARGQYWSLLYPIVILRMRADYSPMLLTAACLLVAALWVKVGSDPELAPDWV